MSAAARAGRSDSVTRPDEAGPTIATASAISTNTGKSIFFILVIPPESQETYGARRGNVPAQPPLPRSRTAYTVSPRAAW